MDKARADFDRFSVKSGLDHRLNVINEALGRRAADSAGASLRLRILGCIRVWSAGYRISYRAA